MTTQVPEHIDEQEHGQHRPPVTVTVNEQSVRFEQHRVTGAQVKATAIAQGVAIEPDFILSLIEHDGSLRQIDDDEHIALHEHLRFVAVSPDDNS